MTVNTLFIKAGRIVRGSPRLDPLPINFVLNKRLWISGSRDFTFVGAVEISSLRLRVGLRLQTMPPLVQLSEIAVVFVSSFKNAHDPLWAASPPSPCIRSAHDLHVGQSQSYIQTHWKHLLVALILAYPQQNGYANINLSLEKLHRKD